MSTAIVAISGFGVVGTLVAFLWWQVIRASSAQDRLYDKASDYHELDKLYIARGVAVEERDVTIGNLEAELLRAQLALEAAIKAMPNPTEESDAVPALRDALTRLRELSLSQMPEAESATTTKDR